MFYNCIDKSIESYKVGSEEAAGYDMFSLEDKWIFPFTVTKVNVNIKLEIEKGWYGFLTSRSGMSKAGVVCIPGIIDSDYRGGVCALLVNAKLLPKKIKKGDRVAQLILMPHYNGELIPKTIKNNTNRGDGGFGSTGTR